MQVLNNSFRRFAEDGVTLTKLISTLKTFQEVKAYTTASSSAAARQVEREGSSRSEEMVTLESLHCDVRSLKKKVKQGFKKIEGGLNFKEDIGYSRVPT